MNIVSAFGRICSPWAPWMWVPTAVFIIHTFGCLSRQSSAPDIPTHEESPKSSPAILINGQAISRSLFEREVRQTISRYERIRNKVNDELKDRLRSSVVKKLIERELIAQKAKEMGVGPTPEQQEKLWQEHRMRYGNEEAFAAFLERARTSAEDFRRGFLHNLLKEAVFNRVREGVTVSGEELREFFEENEEHFRRSEQVRVRHIFIAVKTSASKKVVQEKRALAERLRRQALQPNADFAALASKYGEDSSQHQGGDLGYFPKKKMVKAFEDVAWSLKKGQISAVTRTPFGFHIIKKIDQRPAGHQEFDEVSENIEKGLQAEKEIAKIRASLTAWEQEAEIEILVPITTSSTPTVQGTSLIPGLSGPIGTATTPNTNNNGATPKR